MTGVAAAEVLDLRWAVFGLGSIGRRHLGNLVTLGVEDIVGFDPNPHLRDEARLVHPCGEYRESWDGQSDLGIQVAVVCTPTSGHVELGVRLARAGVHMLIEKPVSRSAGEAGALVDAVAQSEVKTLVACNFRFHPGMAKTREIILGGTLGRPLSFHASFGQYLPDWRPQVDYRETYSAQSSLGGGVLLDRIHELDYLQALFGNPSHVMAMMDNSKTLDIDVEDRVDAILRYPSGLVGSVHLDYLRREYQCSLDVSLEGGWVRWSFNPNEVRWYDAALRRRSMDSWPDYDWNAMYVDQMKHFLAVVAGEEPSMNSVEAGVATVAISDLVRCSAAEGRVMEYGV